MTHTTDGMNNRVKVDCFAFVYEVKFVIRPAERNTFISVYKNHIIKIEDNEMITHSDCQTKRYSLNEISLVVDNDFVNMKELVNGLIDKNFNNKKMQFNVCMLSNRPKLDTFKYVFVFKEFVTRKLKKLRDKKK